MKKTNAIRLLEQKKLPYTTIAYVYQPENLDVVHLAKTNALSVASIYKTLVLKGDRSGIFVTVVAGGRQLDLKKAAVVSGNKKVALLPVKQLQAATGYIRGGCSPIGMKKKYPIYVDESGQLLDSLYVNAGIRGLLVGLSPAALQTATQAQWAAIT
jgi:Cys-tRNA(Pro)/Cys-tRNA(Cys) deacylase